MILDYAEPLIRARQCLTALEDQLINKKDLDAAAISARSAYHACSDLAVAVEVLGYKKAARRVIP